MSDEETTVETFDEVYDELAGETDDLITQEQFIELLDRLRASAPRKSVKYKVLEEGINEDELLSRDQARNIYTAHFDKTEEEKIADYETALQTMDLDRDGVISRDELREYLKKYVEEGEANFDEILEECFNDLDTDHSGYISKDELLKLFFK